MPELPIDKYRRYTGVLGLSAQTAGLLYKYKAVCDFFEKCLSLGAGAKNTANLITGTIYSSLSTEEEKEEFNAGVSAEDMAKLVRYADEGKINVTLAQMTLSKMLKEGGCVDDYITEQDLAGVSDDELEALCRKAVEENPAAAADFRGGKQKAIGSFYGYIKRASGGKADIKRADAILRKILSE